MNSMEELLLININIQVSSTTNWIAYITISSVAKVPCMQYQFHVALVLCHFSLHNKIWSSTFPGRPGNYHSPSLLRDPLSGSEDTSLASFSVGAHCWSSSGTPSSNDILLSLCFSCKIVSHFTWERFPHPSTSGLKPMYKDHPILFNNFGG